MGIKGLNKIIKKVCPHIIKERYINDYRFSKIAIDSSILLYKYRYASDSDDSHIHGFLQRAFFYIKNGIIPVFVFDGMPPCDKKSTIEKRYKQKNKIEDKIKELQEQLETAETSEQINEIEDEIYRLRKQVTYVTKHHKQECKYILKLLGIPVIEANGEAEATCAALQKNNYVDYTFTEDTDSFTFGTPVVIKNSKNLDKFIEVKLDDLLVGMNFTMDQFIDFCILCGCDYSVTIPKIGPLTSLSMIREHGSIEKILENLSEKYTVPDNFNYINSRRLFKEEIDLGEVNIKLDSINTEKLKLFIVDEKQLSINIYNSIVKKYTNVLNDYKKLQKNSTFLYNKKNDISKYFKRYEIKAPQ